MTDQIDSRQLLTALGQAQSMFIDKHPPGEIFDNLLNELLNLTGSEYGFIGQVLENDKKEITYNNCFKILDC